MSEARARHDWILTADLLAMLWNTTPGVKEATSRDDFHPFGRPEEPAEELPPEDVTANWGAFRTLVNAGGFR
jgi:hypothetical protein